MQSDTTDLAEGVGAFAADGPVGTFSCVVDDHPRFHLDALRWFASLTKIAGVDPSDLVVHTVGSRNSDALDFLVRRGVTIRTVEAFDSRSPHCNKISGALSLAAEGVDGLAVLCDTDLAIIEDPRRLPIGPYAVASKPVDAPNPPLGVLTNVFSSAGLPFPSVQQLAWGSPEQTVAGNGNGGLYLVPGPILSALSIAWERWARWMLDRLEILGQWAIHVDQVAMALAIASEGVDPTSLDARWNTPVHDLATIPPDPGEPAIIHYHQKLDPTGRLLLTGNVAIDGRINLVNDAIGDIWRAGFPNATFWQWRYLTDPNLGSGVGSRGQPLQEKRRLLAALLEALRPASVCDVGCGDGETTQDLPLPDYTGIDLSAEATRRAKAGRPEGRYVIGLLADNPIEADLTLNLDVLIHESNGDAYREQVERLWRSAKQALIISGYDRPFAATSPMVHFHEPLSTTLRRVAPQAEIYPVRDEHEITTFVVLRPPPVRHPRDFTSATLDPLIGRHPDPVWLLGIRLEAWRTLGFYPDHAPRLWEYPVVAHLLADTLGPGTRVVDVGAGTTPMAPFLTTRGYVVDTVDPSPTRRVWPPAPDWNEWEYVDYAEAGLANRSWNCVLGALPVEPLYDGAYSVSVIEHLSSDDRRSLIHDMATRVRTGGVVVLTIDLVRGCDQLWNRNRGLEVEDPLKHGTIHDVVAEGSSTGLETFRLEAVRGWGDTEVDIGLIAMRKL